MLQYICPNCKNPIYDDDALLCLYCGESLKRNVGFMGKLRCPKYRILFIAAIIIMLSAFILLMGI